MTNTTSNIILLNQSNTTTLVPIQLNINGSITQISNEVNSKHSNNFSIIQSSMPTECYEPNTYNPNQSEQVLNSSKPSELKTRKYNKSNAKKRASQEIPVGEIKDSTSGGLTEKRLKQEPVSPTEKKLPTNMAPMLQILPVLRPKQSNLAME